MVFFLFMDDNPLYDDSRKNKFGLMKIEQIDIKEGVALQSKVYTIVLGPKSMRKK